MRADEALVARGLVTSRARARDLILRGQVLVDGRAATKPSQNVSEQARLDVADGAANYVSRAALKLVHGLQHFGISSQGRICLDLGASTGGFTQVLLDGGASHVTAIDVGHGQMVPTLSADPRVTLREGVNARALTAADMPQGLSLVVCDVSFISLKLALPPVLSHAPAGTALIALIKPQFEVGREGLGKGGVVREQSQHDAVCADIVAFLEGAGWAVQGVVASPLEGGDGNREFLIAARKG